MVTVLYKVSWWTVPCSWHSSQEGPATDSWRWAQHQMVSASRAACSLKGQFSNMEECVKGSWCHVKLCTSVLPPYTLYTLELTIRLMTASVICCSLDSGLIFTLLVNSYPYTTHSCNALTVYVTMVIDMCALVFCAYSENEVLWREVASLRQMHMKQQHVVSRVTCLLMFHTICTECNSYRL